MVLGAGLFAVKVFRRALSLLAIFFFSVITAFFFTLKNRKKNFMFKFMIWMTAITTIGFIALSILDIGFK